MGQRMRKALAGLQKARAGYSGDAEYDAATELADIIQELLRRGIYRVDIDDLSQILNAGADLVIDSLETFKTETSATIRWRSLIDLVVNAQGQLARTPATTLDEVIWASYSEEPATVRGWIE
jgi:ABC-type transporter Mla MlaB component